MAETITTIVNIEPVERNPEMKDNNSVMKAISHLNEVIQTIKSPSGLDFSNEEKENVI